MMGSMIYHISDGEYVKVGYTSKDTVAQRLRDLQVGNPRTLVCMLLTDGGFGNEGLIHAMLTQEGLHVRGEWFLAQGSLAWCAFPQSVVQRQSPKPFETLRVVIPDDELDQLEREL